MSNLTKRDVENIVNKIVDDKIEMATKKMVEEKDIRKMIQKDIETFYKELKSDNNIKSEKEVQDLIRKSLIKLYKFMWEKSNFFVKNI